VLQANLTGESNTGTGNATLFSNTSGSFNTADGRRALFSSTGNNNTAVGFWSFQSLTSGDNNLAVGYFAGANLTSGSNNIDIGDQGVAAESNTIRIGDPTVQSATFIAGISGTAVGGDTVVVNANGQLGVAPSSERFKAEIKPMDKASQAILALKPVTFRYKKSIDPKGAPQFGLVAEQVEKVNPDLVARDAEGKVYTVRYDAVNAMLLNEFLKEHRKVQELEANAVRQHKQMEELTAGLQKVSAQLEVSRAAPPTVLNNQ
jgi:hypothetical protein